MLLLAVKQFYTLSANVNKPHIVVVIAIVASFCIVQLWRMDDHNS